jgi:hypothetical protein
MVNSFGRRSVFQISVEQTDESPPGAHLHAARVQLYIDGQQVSNHAVQVTLEIMAAELGRLVDNSDSRHCAAFYGITDPSDFISRVF